MDDFTTDFRTPLYSGEAILQLIPQRPPMMLVDAFFGIRDEYSFSGLSVTGDNLFVENGKLMEEGLIEHFAQSAAARVGYFYLQKNESVPIGFIGAVSKFSVHALPEVGSRLKTVVSIIQEVGNITLAGVKSWVNNSLAAEGELKIYINNNR